MSDLWRKLLRCHSRISIDDAEYSQATGDLANDLTYAGVIIDDEYLSSHGDVSLPCNDL